MRNIVQVTTAFLILVFMVAPSVGQPGKESGKVEKLYRITQGAVGDVKITDNGAAGIRDLLGTAVKNSKASDAEMSEGARKFGRALAGKARFDESAGGKVIDKSVVEAARGSFCPAYPVC